MRIRRIAQSLTCTIVLLAAIPAVGDETDKRPNNFKGYPDPRLGTPSFTVWFSENDKGRNDAVTHGKILIATETKAGDSFRFAGGKKRYTADQAINELRRFYRDQKSDKKTRANLPPLVLAFEKDGIDRAAGAKFKSLAVDLEIDVYRLGPIDKNKPDETLPAHLRLSLRNEGMKAENRKASIKDALLVFARLKGKNEILGIETKFTDAEISRGLSKFYEEWKKDEQSVNDPPPIVWAAENWGAGGQLLKVFETLSDEYGVDVYLHYVVPDYAITTDHPTRNDKRLEKFISE